MTNDEIKNNKETLAKLEEKLSIVISMTLDLINELDKMKINTEDIAVISLVLGAQSGFCMKLMEIFRVTVEGEKQPLA